MMRPVATTTIGRLVQPIESARGNLGLFRIAYSAFYLWHLSYVQAGLLAAAPPENWQPVFIFESVFNRPPVWLPGLIESALAGLLVFLLVGLHSRTVTGLVFVFGFILDGFLQSLGKVEHGSVFLTFYLPLVMSFSVWGETYSIDAMRRGISDPSSVSSESLTRRQSRPVKLVLLLLSFLFLTAGLSKLLGGYWLHDPDILADLVARAHYRSILDGLTPNPFADTLLSSALLDSGLRIIVPTFECLFALVLVGPLIRRLYIALAVIFHATNAIFLGVTFTPVLIAYGIAVDWRGLLERIRTRIGGPRKLGPRAIPTGRFEIAASLLALAVAFDWNHGGVGRAIVSFGGTINWLTIWYVMGPAALGCILANSFRLLKSRSGGR